MPKTKYYHLKLIRDKVPDWIKTIADDLETRVLSEAEFGQKLKEKLVEEAKELETASSKRIESSLIDVLELVKSVAACYKIKFSDLEKSQLEKRKERGGYDKKLFLIWSTGKTEN